MRVFLAIDFLDGLQDFFFCFQFCQSAHGLKMRLLEFLRRHVQEALPEFGPLRAWDVGQCRGYLKDLFEKKRAERATERRVGAVGKLHVLVPLLKSAFDPATVARDQKYYRQLSEGCIYALKQA